MKIKKSELADFRKALTAGIAGITKRGNRVATGEHIETTPEYVSLTKYIRGTMNGNWTGAEHEERVFKALNSTIGTQGGFLVPVEIEREIIDMLRNKAVVRGMPGVRVKPMSSDTWTQRRVDVGAEAFWGVEGSTIDESTTIALGKISLQLKKLTSMYKVNRETIYDADVSADAFVKEELAKAAALKEDTAFLKGTGSNEPLGLYNHPRINWTRLDATMTFDDLLAAHLEIEYQNSEITGWIGNPRTKHQLRTLKDADGRVIYVQGKNTDAGNRTMDSLYGVPAEWTNQVAKTVSSAATESFMVGGNWNDFIIGDSTEGLRIEATDVGGSAFRDDQVWIKLVKRVDCALIHPESFIKIQDIQA